MRMLGNASRQNTGACVLFQVIVQPKKNRNGGHLATSTVYYIELQESVFKSIDQCIQYAGKL